MELDDWAEVDATTWTPVVGHVVGKREKRWVEDAEGEVWLEKFPKSWRPSELAIEVFASALARALGIDAAACHVAVDGERRALVSRRFLAGEEQLLHGDQLLEDVVPGYDPENRSAHTIVSVRDAVARRLGSTGVVRMIEMLALDAWLGHSDRHPQNWGVIVRPGGERLAPMYDTAACLGAELSDARATRLLRDAAEIERYVRVCPSGFGNGVDLIGMVEAEIELRLWPEWRPALATCVPRFRSLLAPAQSYLRRIPLPWLSEPHQELACVLLARRLEWLEGLTS